MVKHSLALVTGAAHRLGRIFALFLASQGFGILLHYHLSKKEAEKTAKEIKALGVPVFLVQADLTQPGEIQSLFSELDSQLSTHEMVLKVLVNSASTMPRTNIRILSSDEWDSVLTLNLRAPFLLAKQAAERMTEGGLIVNVTDAGAGKAWTGYPAYTVSKAALESLTRVLAKAYAPSIRINAIAPGLVLPSKNIRPDEWEQLVTRLPLKRPTPSDDITNALEFLLKSESVTGQTIVLDGGYSLL